MLRVRASIRRSSEKPTFSWLLRRGHKKKRVLRATIPLSLQSNLVISLRRFRTPAHRRSTQFTQYVFALRLLAFREAAIAIKPRRRKRAKGPVGGLKNLSQLTDQAFISLLLIVAGLTGSLHFGTNLKVAPHLSIGSSSSVTQNLAKNTGIIASELKHNQKVDLIKPIAEVASPPVPEEPVPPKVMDRSVPLRIRIPKIEVDTSLISAGLGPNGAIELPSVFDQAMWYDQSPTPGERGPSVITGHVDSPHNIAIFWRLRELLPGDTVQIDRQDGTTATFTITNIQQYPQDQFPTQAVYGGIDYAGLRLVTCGGTFNAATGHYSDNTVVYGRLVQS